MNPMDHLGLVRSVARKMYGRVSAYYDLDDLEQMGFIGLMRACEKHDPSRAKFSTFAYLCIFDEIYKQTISCRLVRPPMYTMKKGAKHGDFADHALCVGSLPEDFDVGHSIRSDEDTEHLMHCVERLRPNRRRLVRDWLRGKSQAQMARERGVERQAVWQMLKKTSEQLREMYFT